jgi:hypothetical protein
MKTKKILLVAGVTLTAVIVLYSVRRKKFRKKKLHVVAEEGYETAEDILFPKKKFLRIS